MIRDSVPAIGKVTLKGGAELHLVGPAASMAGFQSSMFTAVHLMQAKIPDTVGYFFVSWDRNGAWTKALRVMTAGNPVLWRLLPAFVEEVARAAVVEEDIAGELRYRGIGERT